MQHINPLLIDELHFFLDNDLEQTIYAKELLIEILHSYTDYLVKNNIAYIGIEYLSKAIRKLQSSPSTLTSIHSDLLHLCLSSKILKPSLELVNINFTDIDLENNKWNSKHLLLYFYYGGIVLYIYRKYQQAFYFFEAGLTIPTLQLSMITLEMFKKYILLSLIVYQKAVNPSKCSSQVIKWIQQPCQSYVDFANIYTHNDSNLNDLNLKINAHSNKYNHDGNMGLIRRCKKSFLQNKISKISKVYLTITLDQLTKFIELINPESTKLLLEEMVATNIINISYDSKKGTLAFYDRNFVADEQLVSDTKISRCLTMREQLDSLNDRLSCDTTYLNKVVAILSEDIPGNSKTMSVHLNTMIAQ